MERIMIGPVELMCLYLIPLALFIGGVVYLAKVIRERKAQPPPAQPQQQTQQPPPIEPKG